MVDLDSIRSLQDYSGMLHAGSVIEWASQTDRNPKKISSADLEEYLCWAYDNQVKFKVTSEEDLERILVWINDPKWDNSEACDLFVQVQNSKGY
jgi:hypothetical protein